MKTIGLGTLLQIPNMRYRKVTYYTVWQLNAEKPEFELFRQRFRQHQTKAVHEDYQRIINRIDDMGEHHGCREHYFVPERNAHRINQPVAPEVKAYFNGRGESRLRLYCIRISKSVCVLLNGDVKTARTAQECPQVGHHFHFAISVANSIQQMTTDKTLALYYDDNLPMQVELTPAT